MQNSKIVKKKKTQEEAGASSWSDVPQALQLRVLELLPLLELLQLQSVCKAWRLSSFSSQSPLIRDPWLVLHVGECYVAVFSLRSNRLFFLRPQFWTPWDEASAGGLIVRRGDRRSLHIINPLNRVTKTLQQPKRPDFVQASFKTIMLANPSAGFYQIIHFSCPCPDRQRVGGEYMQVYDSRTQSWVWQLRDSSGKPDTLVYDSTSQVWEWKQLPHSSTHSSYSFVDDDLFVLDKHKGAMFSYNAERCMWTTLEAHVPSCGGRLGLALETVVKCQGRLLLVGILELQEQDDWWTVEGLGVWEWQSVGQRTGRWAELARTPPEYWGKPYRSQFLPSLYCALHCTVVNDHFISMIGWDGADILPFKYWPHLAYDLDCRSWQRLPLDDHEYHSPIFLYEPSWNAVP